MNERSKIGREEDMKQHVALILGSRPFGSKQTLGELLEILADAYLEGKVLTGTEVAEALYATEVRKRMTDGGKNAAKTAKGELAKQLERYYRDEGQHASFTIRPVNRAFAIEIGPPPRAGYAKRAGDAPSQNEPTSPLDVSPRRSLDVAASEHRHTVHLRWIAVISVIAASLAIVPVAFVWGAPIRITSPADGSTVEVNRSPRTTITVEGTGGRPLLFRYLLVEPEGDARFVQQCREFDAAYFSHWTCEPVYIGDSWTPAGAQFRIYVFETPRPLKEGVDFELQTGRLSESIARNYPPHMITVTLAR